MTLSLTPYPLRRDDKPRAVWPEGVSQQWPVGWRVTPIGCHNCPRPDECAERRACQHSTGRPA